MVGVVLVVLTDGFDDMAYLSTQVILEESGFDVISSSPSGGAIKGETSSVMTVSFQDAISQDTDYAALILIGGNSIDSIDGLVPTIQQYHQNGKVIAAFGRGVDVLATAGITSNLSTGPDITSDGTIHTMKDPEKCEEFVEFLVTVLS